MRTLFAIRYSLFAKCTWLITDGDPQGCNQDRDDLAKRIQDAREDVADARDDQTRTKAEQYLSHLTTLEAAI